MGVILIVDDQSAVRTALEVLFEVHGLVAESVPGPREAIARVRQGDVAVVIQDMNFSSNTTTGEEGIVLFRQLRAIDPKLPVLLLTAWTSLETAVMLVKEGASDYLQKPWDDQKLLASVQQLLRIRTLEEENELLRRDRSRPHQDLAQKYDLRGLVYASDAMHDVVSLAVQVARADVPVLITGPNGCGKEKIADIVQANSRRREKPFIKVNAGALPDALLESELFGAEAGAYTGATRQRIGRFEAADTGTLFLDEVGNLSISGQMKLLRVLQTGEFQRLGSSVDRRVDVRLISATNADLQAAIAEKTFREDLFFRLNVIELRVPPLRERPDDILPLATHVLAELANESRSPRYELSAEARDALLSYAWPGNVRELQNRLKRAVLLCQGNVVRKTDLGLEVGDTGHGVPDLRIGEGQRREPVAIGQRTESSAGVGPPPLPPPYLPGHPPGHASPPNAPAGLGAPPLYPPVQLPPPPSASRFDAPDLPDPRSDAVRHAEANRRIEVDGSDPRSDAVRYAEANRRVDAEGPDRATIEAALVRAGGKIARAATDLGLSRQALYRRMDRLGITVERRLKGAGRGE